MKEQADLYDGTNFIIYGHNMKDGSMFENPDLYLKENFYKEQGELHFIYLSWLTKRGLSGFCMFM